MKAVLGLVMVLASVGVVEAGRIGEWVEASAGERALKFFRFEEPSLRYALVGSMLLGVTCGMMGAFLVVRRLALMGDALAHAVLPGVAAGFLWGMRKDPVAIFVGATVAGLLGAGVVQLLRRTTRHKEDAALGFVLASFFGVGICLITMIQHLPIAAKSGLDQFLFGQAASMGGGEVALLGVVAAVCVVSVAAFFKEFRLLSFDEGFARAVGLPVRWLQGLLMLLLAFAIVAALQAVGVVLVSAMLVIPAAAAFLLTDRLGVMVVLGAVFGLAAGALGAFFSYVGEGLPTGPLMVLAGAGVFVAAFLAGPRHGVVARWWLRRSRAARHAVENTLKAVYQVLESGGFQKEEVGLGELAARRRVSLREVAAEVRRAGGMLTRRGDGVAFTPDGWRRACEIVRNHRLWELYLTNVAELPADHVHEDAEKIEHVLGEETVARLEKRLHYARRDPHGKLIPGLEDIRAGGASGVRAVGFGRGEG